MAKTKICSTDEAVTAARKYLKDARIQADVDAEIREGDISLILKVTNWKSVSILSATLCGEILAWGYNYDIRVV